MPRRYTFTAVRIGLARDGIGIRGSARTRSFRATEFSIARLAGDSTRRSMRDGRRLGLATDSDTADITGAITIISGMTIMLGGLDRTTILEFAAVDLRRAVGLLAFVAAGASTAVRASMVVALAVDSMAAVEASAAVVVGPAAGTGGNTRPGREI